MGERSTLQKILILSLSKDRGLSRAGGPRSFDKLRMKAVGERQP